MVQTGDPTGTGKGGQCIWGGKFEDEIDETLKVKTHKHSEVKVISARKKYKISADPPTKKEKKRIPVNLPSMKSIYVILLFDIADTPNHTLLIAASFLH